MRLDLDLPVGEELGDDAGEQQIVGLADFDGRRRLQPRREVGQRHPPGGRKAPRRQQQMRAGGRAPR